MIDVKTPPKDYSDAVDHPYDWVDPTPGVWTPIPGIPGAFMTLERARLDTSAWELKNDPWTNGRYALASIIWGLIILLVLGLGAGP